MKKLLTVITPILFVLIIWISYPIFFPISENQKIENVLNAAVKAFENKNSKEVLKYAVEDLKIKSGGDVDEAIMRMKAFFFKVRELEASSQYIVHEVKKLPRDAKEAKVIFVAKISGKIDGENFQAFGNHGADALLLTMKKIKDSWKVGEIEYLDTSNPLKAFEQAK